MLVRIFRIIAFFALALIIPHTLEGKEKDTSRYLEKKLYDEDNPYTKVKILIKLSDFYINKDLSRSLEYVENAKAIAASFQNDSLNAKLNFMQGNIHFRKSELAAAQGYYNKCYEYSLQNNDLLFRFFVLGNSGSVYQMMLDYDLALKKYEESYALLPKLLGKLGQKNYDEKRIQLLNNIGNVYNAKGNPNKAFENYKRALCFAESSLNNEAMGFLCRNIGEFFMDKGSADSAYKYLIKSYKARQSVKDYYGLATSCLSLGKYYVIQNDEKAAIAILNKGKSYAVATGAKLFEMEVENQLYHIYKGRGNLSAALTAFERYKTLNDTLNNIKQAKEIAKTQHQLEYAKEKAEMQIAAKRRDILFIGGIVALALLVIALTLVVFVVRIRYRWLSVKTKESELDKARKDMELESANRELATSVLYLSQKNDLISGIIRQFHNFKSQLDEKYHTGVDRIIAELNGTLNTGSWDEFEMLFNKVNGKFYERLVERYPDLSSSDRRLCIFLKLNMSTKEIMAITGQSLKAIDMARYRLRKKFSLSGTGRSLTTFLNELDR